MSNDIIDDIVMKYLILFILWLVCTSCVQSIHDYARYVYDYQHSVLLKLMNTQFQIDQDSTEAKYLWNLESELNNICGPLQEIGRRKMFGEEITAELEYQVSIILSDCEKKAIEIDDILNLHGF